jgi:hypothetical protein
MPGFIFGIDKERESEDPLQRGSAVHDDELARMTREAGEKDQFRWG